MLPEAVYLTEYWHRHSKWAGPRIYASSDQEAFFKAKVLEEMFGYPPLTILGKLRDEFDARDIYYE